MASGTTALTPQQTVYGSSQLDRVFYLVAAGTILLLTFVGFEGFYLHGSGFGGAPITRQIVPLVVVHGLAMSSWLVLLCVQSTLIVAGNRRLHMTTGIVGALLAGIIVILGACVAMLSVHFNPEPYDKYFGGARFFLAIILTGIVTFGALVAIGIRYRRRPEIHRPMMLLATVVLMTAPFDRWPFIPKLMALTHNTVPLFHYGPMLVLGALLFFLQWGLTRAMSRWYAVGYAGVLIGSLASVALATSSLWDRVARIIVH